jgi:RNA polymerase sigma-70 factor (ECF subfamily)
MSDEPLDVAAWIERIRRGDAEAARRLVERCHPLVARLVRAHRSRTLSEDDLAQEVYLKMFARLDRYEAREGIPFEHWLSRLAVRTCLDALRAEGRRPMSRTVALSPAAEGWLASLHGHRSPPIDEVLAARELVDALLVRLPPVDRLVLVLLDVEERSAAEVAQLVGWSATLVRVRAFRARRRLRAAALELMGPGPGNKEPR